MVYLLQGTLILLYALSRKERLLTYHITFAPEAHSHLRRLPARQQAIVLSAIPRHLAYQPLLPSRNRKPLRSNAIAPWELRIGHLRVLFEVSCDPVPSVHVLVVGRKQRNRVLIGDEVLELEKKSEPTGATASLSAHSELMRTFQGNLSL